VWLWWRWLRSVGVGLAVPDPLPAGWCPDGRKSGRKTPRWLVKGLVSAFPPVTNRHNLLPAARRESRLPSKANETGPRRNKSLDHCHSSRALAVSVRRPPIQDGPTPLDHSLNRRGNRCPRERIGYGIHPSRPDRPHRQPTLPRHHELRPAHHRGRLAQDHGSGTRARHQLLRHGQPVRRGRHRADHRHLFTQGDGRRERTVLAPSSTAPPAIGRTRASSQRSTSAAPVMRRCSGCRPTTSICTRCTTSTATHRGTRSGRRWRS